MSNHEFETLYYFCINEELLLNGLCCTSHSFSPLIYIYIHVHSKSVRTHSCWQECILAKLLIIYLIFCLSNMLFERELKQRARTFWGNPAAFTLVSPNIFSPWILITGCLTQSKCSLPNVEAMKLEIGILEWKGPEIDFYKSA